MHLGVEVEITESKDIKAGYSGYKSNQHNLTYDSLILYLRQENKFYFQKLLFQL